MGTFHFKQIHTVHAQLNMGTFLLEYNNWQLCFCFTDYYDVTFL